MKHCKYCDRLVHSFVRVFDDNGRVIWAGCFDCYMAKKEAEKE